MTGGSSGGSGAAVASYTAAIAITEDTSGSTNTPAVRNHLFGYDPPKFHYPNGGNPSLTYRNDQLGVVARSIDDIIAFDIAVLGTGEAHAAAKAYVKGLKNSDITLGCSPVYYAYDDMSEAIRAKYKQAEMALKDAGFSFVEDCQEINPMDAVPAPEGFSESAVWYEELANFMSTMLGLPDFNPWEVLLNGYYDFGNTLSGGWMYENTVGSGCALIGKNSAEARTLFLGPIPANRSDVYNAYFDDKGVDLLMGPGQICDKVLWTEDMGANGGCDGGRFPGGCMFNCHTAGVLGTRDKTFTKAKFIVPIGLTEMGEPLSLQFMSRAGPRNPTVSASQWVFDEEGPKTWNLEELYMVKRISETLAAAGLARVDAPVNKISGLVLSPAPAPAPAAVTDDDDDDDGLSGWGIIGMMVGVVAVFVMIYVLFRGSKEETPTNEAQKDDSFDTDAQETYTQ
jgi:Amidase